ncbi:MAG: dipeptidase [Deltaproteobacteria bacterium]|nr:dipeptidase [Deltaproteobacteria bacterium]
MDDVLFQIASQEEATLSTLFEFLRIPTVSADPSLSGEVKRGAMWLADRFREAGFAAGAHPTGGHPAVVAEWRGAKGAPTVLVYGHYDVQPAESLDAWTSPPFEPVVRDGNICGRGASDDKGQLLCHLAGAAAHLKARRRLPVNLVFLIEGEEESGSVHLEPFLEANRERLTCDAVVVSDSSQFAAGVPALTYGLRGLAYLEAILTGPDHDLHSGSFGGAVRNPANALAAMIAALHDDTGRVAIPGFYDDVRPLEAWEREAFRHLPFDEAAYRRGLGVDALWGEAGYSTLERVWARPTLDVNGLWSGYSGEGAKTVLPSKAGVKLSCRLVPDQDPDRVAGLLEDRLRALCPPGCTVEVRRLHGARPVLTPVDVPAVAATRRAVQRAFGAVPVFIREGGSIPVVETFGRMFGAPVVLLGFGRPDDRAHGPDEKLNLGDFRAGVRASAWLWEELGKGGA